MKLALSRLHFPVTTLGPGSRIGIWFQGCSIRCPGCVSMDTWAPEKGITTVQEVMEALKPYIGIADGITISGGEPFDQKPALHNLLSRLRKVQTGDILVYSGYSIETLQPYLDEFSILIDALIVDPFRADYPQTIALRGSDNQRLFSLSPLGHSRFRDYQRLRGPTDNKLDLTFNEETGEVLMAGIPSRDDLQRLGQILHRDGHKIVTSEDDRRQT